jgi:hypothetical protein
VVLEIKTPAHNLSYSGDKDQEDLDWKPACINSLQNPITKKQNKTKNPSQKRIGAVAQGVGCEFKPQY